VFVVSSARNRPGPPASGFCGSAVAIRSSQKEISRKQNSDRTKFLSQSYKEAVAPRIAAEEGPRIPQGDAAHVEDETLLAQVGRGERGALETLYHRHAPSLFALLTRMLCDHQMAEEAVQDTFLAVWKGARFDGRSRVRTWLVAIAIRQAGSQRRRRKWALGNHPRDLASNDPSPEDAAVAGLDVDRLVKDLSDLTRLQREVVLLAFAEQLTHSEIADVLDVRIGTVKSRLHGAKKALSVKWSQEDKT
jgi:RNA polymerase sigma-70 factor, ECF subfamily